MGYTPSSKFEVSLASGATLSTFVDLGRGWNHLSVVIPTMTSGTNVFFQGAGDSSDTFRRIYHPIANGDNTPDVMSVDSSVTNCIVPLEFISCRYLKVELGTAMTATAATFHVVCS